MTIYCIHSKDQGVIMGVNLIIFLSVCTRQIGVTPEIDD